jgi:hypothetical protein
MVRFLWKTNELLSMKFHYKILAMIFLALLITGCKKNHALNEKQHILFQYEYINHASGYNHEGFFIDDEGNIMTYKNPEGWNFRDQNNNFTEARLDENISRCTKSDIKISREELARFSSYIDNIALSKVTKVKNIGADAGTSVFICYDLDEDNGVYKGSLIRMEGDLSCENLNFYSKKVTLWLKDINKTLSK